MFRARSGADGGDVAGHPLPAQRQPALCTGQTDTLYAAALNGLGIAGLPSFVIEDALLEHALERVLPAWPLFDIGLWAGMPSRHHLPARTRAFLNFLLEIFGGDDRDPWLAAAGCETAQSRWPRATQRGAAQLSWIIAPALPPRQVARASSRPNPRRSIAAPAPTHPKPIPDCFRRDPHRWP